MTQNAIVSNILEDGWAEVAVERFSACGHDCAGGGGAACGNCLFNASGRQPLTVRAKNPVGAAVGDRVVIESGTGAVLSAAVLAYLLPLAFLLAALAITASAGATEPVTVITALISFALGFAASVVINGAIRRDRQLEYTIVDIA
jgi:sigma-E factor negative regulatory protein RseC